MPRAARPARLREPGLIGAWWRCPAHGLTEEPVVLGGIAYCRDAWCSERIPLVHSALDDRPEANWNERGGERVAPWREGDA